MTQILRSTYASLSQAVTPPLVSEEQASGCVCETIEQVVGVRCSGRVAAWGTHVLSVCRVVGFGPCLISAFYNITGNSSALGIWMGSLVLGLPVIDK